MKMEYQGYNQTINQLYFNPYSHNFNKLNSPTASHQNIQSATQQYGLLAPDKNTHGIRSMQELQPRQSRQKGMRLSASQIFTSIQKQPQISQPPQKPTINYFVTQFQRLQQQNKHLLQQIQQLKKGQGMANSQQNIHLSLMQQNRYLRQQLEEQQKLNVQKNQQIQRLINQIEEIQREVGCVMRRRVEEKREQEERRRRDMDREQEREKVFAYQIQQLKQEMQQKFEKQKQTMLQQHEQQLGTLLSQQQQQQQQQLQQQKLLQQQQQQQQLQQQQILSQYQNKLQWYSQKLKEGQKQKEEWQRQYNQKIEGVKLYYNDLISQQTYMLMERIGELEVQVEGIKSQYHVLEEEVNNIKYVPAFK